MQALGIHGAAAALLAAPALSFLLSPPRAHESYHDPDLDGAGFCASCHPGFTGGKNSPLHQLHTGGSDPITKSCDLCHTGKKRDNPLLMWSDGDGLGCMGCHGRDYGELIWADYRGLPTAAKNKASGYGLRRLHVNAGVLYCIGCHSPTPPQGPIYAESVPPPYYSRDDVQLGGLALDPCANEDTLFDPDGFGLDNDGDGLTDAADPDCQPPVADIWLDPWLLYWDVVFIGASDTRVVQIHNLGEADLVVTQVGLCSDTSAEFGWSPEPPFSIPPFTSQSLVASYAPVDLGSDYGCLAIVSNDPDERVAEVQLSAQAAAPPWPDIQLSPESLDFGVVEVGGSLQLEAEIQNLGLQELVVAIVEQCAETSAEYSWTPAAPLAVPPLGSETLQVTFSPLDEGVESGCVRLFSNDPDEPLAELALFGNGGNAGQEVDLDIALFRASNNASVGKGKHVAIDLGVENMGLADEPRQATVVGVQNQVTVYEQSLSVSDPPGGANTTWPFPSYAPNTTGDIVWTVTIEDDDPDLDQATAVTKVGS